eukprot:gnl/TRDRNA2_/TRDRNA2_177773_c0_seq7.p1 gnl/TRDRNA2_/TRDRNA2_177773_c0~~gnl/TRDRNA2_/TRDRNA2_177773_c0_seq7.p1  ORF type:complete len:165 (-),score=35.62 gnl/TRDRNA2_/TRDRNA2_177773_c0_seq7:62-556(-)
MFQTTFFVRNGRVLRNIFKTAPKPTSTTDLSTSPGIVDRQDIERARARIQLILKFDFHRGRAPPYLVFARPQSAMQDEWRGRVLELKKVVRKEVAQMGQRVNEVGENITILDQKLEKNMENITKLDQKVEKNMENMHEQMGKLTQQVEKMTQHMEKLIQLEGKS